MGSFPPNNLESAIAISLTPGRYTAIVTGKNNQTGIGLIEIYGSPFMRAKRNRRRSNGGP